MIICNHCGIQIDETNMYKSLNRHICKQCWNALKREYYYTHHEKRLEYKRKRRQEDKDKGLLLSVCRILEKHHEALKNDPERLTTEFIQKVIGKDFGCGDDIPK